jgi:hypothetical protein
MALALETPDSYRHIADARLAVARFQSVTARRGGRSTKVGSFAIGRADYNKQGLV